MRGYQPGGNPPNLPAIIAYGGAGTVNRVGPGITNVKEGDLGQPILCEIPREAMAGRIKPETSAIVVDCGVVGLRAAQGARLCGASIIVVVDVNPLKL